MMYTAKKLRRYDHSTTMLAAVLAAVLAADKGTSCCYPENQTSASVLVGLMYMLTVGRVSQTLSLKHDLGFYTLVRLVPVIT